MFRAPFGARYNFFFGRLVFALLRRMSDLRTIKVRDASMRRKIIESRSPEKTWLQKTEKVLSKPLKEDAPLSQPLRRKSAPFYAVKRPQSENKSINNDIHLRSAICSLFRGQTSAEAVLCLLNPGIDQSTTISICALLFARFFAVKRPRFAACCQATTNLRSNAST